MHQYLRNPVTGEVIALAADFIHWCGGAAAAPLTGRIEYWATYQVASACATPDPFANLGGGTCYAGGWLPPGMPVPSVAASRQSSSAHSRWDNAPLAGGPPWAGSPGRESR